MFDLILVAVDFSRATSLVTTNARALARAFGSELILLKVAEPTSEVLGYEPAVAPALPLQIPLDHEAERRELSELKRDLESTGCKVTALHVIGPAAASILDEAAQRHASLIVMGSRGHGAVYDLLVGSVTKAVLHKASCPVLVVPVSA